MATTLITWLQSKTLVLGLIEQTQKQLGLRATTIIRAVITRWTSHLQAFKQLKSLQDVLLTIISTDASRAPQDRLFLGVGKKNTRDKSAEAERIIQDPFFWNGLDL